KKQSLQTEIAEHIGIDPAAITRQLKILEKEGFVTRDRNADNAREIIVTLTDYAKSELQICKQNHKDNPCNVAVSISKKEIEDLMEILESIEEKL
ncbi:MAG: MarR family transcriptional regulator, partial [Finegoldia magna]|nr:MarR family transcriptional regulator [Finegoldia magna]